MGNLVGEDRRHFVVALKRLQQAPSYKDVPGRHRERINVVRVDNLEPVPVALERNRPAVENPFPDTLQLLL